MKPYYSNGGVAIYHGDSREVLPALPAADLAFTSPPYAQQRNYTAPIGNWTALMCGVFVFLKLKEAGQVLVNLGPTHDKGTVQEYWREWCQFMQALGWRYFGHYIWDQGSGLPGDWNGRLAPSHEFLFHFNRHARRPNKTKPCKHAGARTGAALRGPDGTLHRSAKAAAGMAVQPFKIPDSVVRVPRHMNRCGVEAKHPALGSVGLAQEIIAAYTQPGELVVDPFGGAGTTLVAARELGRQAIGIDVSEAYCEIAAKRLEASAS